MKKETADIKIVSIKECVPNSWNPNEMNALQFAALKKAITKFGQTKPIQVGVWPKMPVKEGYIIVGGYHTWKILSSLGKTEITVNVHDFANEDEAKLYSLTDNIHGSNQQLKLGKLAYDLNKSGYSIKQIAQHLGEEDLNVKDALDLVQEEIEKKMKELKNAERENFVAVNFIVDKDPKLSAELFIEAVTAFAKAKGVKVGKVATDINKSRETIALVSFNVTNPQKGVIEEAVAHVAKVDDVNESVALERVCSEFLLTASNRTQPKHGKN